MSTTIHHQPTSHVRFGVSRADITPPPNIYHPMWGAARHQRAAGIHRPLYADVMVFGSLAESGDGTDNVWLQIQLDIVGLAAADHDEIISVAAGLAEISRDNVTLAYSHTHAGGLFNPDRVSLPGGELIPPYLAQVKETVTNAAAEAMDNMQEAFITYGSGHCDLAVVRDFWDDENNLYACGYNPDEDADDTVVVARIATPNDQTLATLVNYACHPTTLAWANQLISPDYPGALREEVERVTGAPCIFTLGACGDLGPRLNYMGDTAVADSNGRQVGFAALSTLESLDPAGMDFHYQGPVISGATLGTWDHEPFSTQRLESVSHFAGGRFSVDLPLKPRPDTDALQAELADWLQRQQEADDAGDAIAARDYGARAERARRWLGRLSSLQTGSTMPFHFTVRRMGDAIWISTSGEPYNILQTHLREQFPDETLIITVMAGELGVAYLLPHDRYGQGLYQEEPSIFAPGCLEQLLDAIQSQVQTLVSDPA